MNDIFVKAPDGVKLFSSSNRDNNVVIKTHEKFNPNHRDDHFKVLNNLSELDTEYKKKKARENLGIDLVEIAKAGVQVTWDDELNKLKIATDTNAFVSSCFEKIEPPASPTISILEYSTVIGSIPVTITNNKEGSKLYYSLDGIDYTETSGIINLESGFTNTITNSNKQYNIFVKASYNGEYSEINEYTITIKPKCNPGTISVTKNGNNNNYSTQATIKFTPSSMIGTKTYYSDNKGGSWTELLGIKTVDVNKTIAADSYQLKVEYEGYETSYTKSPAITLNALKTYYGCSTKATLTNNDISKLVGGGVLESSGIAKNTKYNLSIPEPSYIWICQSGTLAPNSVFHESTDTIPAGFNNAVKIGSYNCYRSIEIWKEGSSSIYLK